MEERLANGITFAVAVGISLLTLTAAWSFYFLPPDRAAALLGPMALYLPRLAPLLGQLIVGAAVALALILAHRFGLRTEVFNNERPALRLAALLFAGFLLIWLVIKLTGLGLGFDLTEWNAPGAPLLSSQIFLVGFVSLVVLALAKQWPGFWNKYLGIIFLLMFPLFWLFPVAAPSYYSSPPVPPSFEGYPLSDAFNHDVIANNVLIGEGFRFNDLQAVRKPLYALVLAGLHKITEGDYRDLLNDQMRILIFFPFILYFLGRRLHSHLAGLLMAGFVLIREANGVHLSGIINVSHAQLLMADLPAALGLAGLGLLAVHWLTYPEQRRLALWTGGVLGLLLLLRSQNLTLIPALALLAIPALRSKQMPWRSVWFSLALFVVGIMLAVGPWLLRNHALTSEWIIEQSTAASYLAQRYSDDPASIQTDFLPGETEGEYYARHMAQVKGFIAEQPGKVAGFVADNYLRNLYLTVMPLPLSFELRGLEAHVRELPYWPSWDGALLSETLLPLTFNLALIALGIALAWRHLRWAGLVPLALNLGFSLNLALARVSGWRYNQPVDWTLMLYYALGLAQLLIWVLALIGKTAWMTPSSPEPKPRKPSRLPSWVAPALAPILIIALGCTPIAVERLIPPRFQPMTREEAALILDAAFHNQQSAALVHLLETNQVTPYVGRALYPREYDANEGEPDSDFALTAVQPFSRLTFYLVGPEPLSVSLPTPFWLPSDPVFVYKSRPKSGVDVIVFACRGGVGRAAGLLELVSNGDPRWLYAGDPATACE